MKTTKPLIGIVPDYKEGSPTCYSAKPFYALRHNYVDMINKVGGAAIILPYDYDLIDDYLNAIDGLMIVGGYFDIHPKRYGASEIHPTVKLNEIRENFEYAIGKKAMEKNLPFLGICNGMQLLNVLHGGNVIQHIPDEGKFMDHEQSHFSEFKDYTKAYHYVNIVKGSKLSAIIGEEKIKTNSSHHQATKHAGAGLNVCGLAEDGIIEAIEKPNHDFCIGVQWHPEFDVSCADKKIFDEFIKISKKYKGTK
jgi:putative glutamine amidotransferase